MFYSTRNNQYTHLENKLAAFRKYILLTIAAVALMVVLLLMGSIKQLFTSFSGFFFPSENKQVLGTATKRTSEPSQTVSPSATPKLATQAAKRTIQPGRTTQPTAMPQRTANLKPTATPQATTQSVNNNFTPTNNYNPSANYYYSPTPTPTPAPTNNNSGTQNNGNSTLLFPIPTLPAITF